MNDLNHQDFSFNLWHEPWIELEKPDGSLDRQGIVKVLLHAQEYQGVFSSSPLEVVGIHRLLTAILQDALQPSGLEDLRALWRAGRFPSESIEEFGAAFAHRFDLFSPDQPFLQSGDLPLRPNELTPIKPVTYLAQDLPCATAINHYHHLLDEEQVFCPACCARGLVVIPAFATTGGRGIKPSINGIPPLYVLPGGNSLFESLATSLILPPFQPLARNLAKDSPWWRREAHVGKSEEVISVGYLESLTFPARRVRLYPQMEEANCTRCGAPLRVGVRGMTFEMGLLRPKDSPFWQDPFVAYSLHEESSPIPLRPAAGKALWREFSSLFLKIPFESSSKNKRLPQRPRLIDQLAWMEETGVGPNESTLSFRCIGMRTDKKAKIFEWVDSGFNVPLTLLQSSDAGLDVDDAMRFSAECEGVLSEVFRKYLNSNKKGERFLRCRTSLQDAYWSALIEPFRLFIANLAEIYALPQAQRREKGREILSGWYRQSITIARRELEKTLEQVGDNGHNLRLRFQCLEEFNKRMYGKLKKKQGENKYE